MNSRNIPRLYDLLCIFLLVILIWGIYRQGFSLMSVTGILLITLLAVLRRFNLVVKFNVIAIFGIAIAVSYGYEIYAIVSDAETVSYGQVMHDRRSKIQVLQDLRLSGERVTLGSFTGAIISEESAPEFKNERFFPFGGISSRKTILCQESNGWSIYVSDEKGFNNVPGLYESDIEILMVGDSFTHGFCVDQNQTVAANLRSVYPKTISLGSGGNGELSRLGSLIEYGPHLKPRIVLWIYTENTLLRVRNELLNPTLRSYLKGNNFSQNLYEEQTRIDEVLGSYLERKEREALRNEPHSSFLDFFTLKKFRNFLAYSTNKIRTSGASRAPDQPLPKDFLISEQILKKAQTVTGSWGGKLYFVYLGGMSSRKTVSDHNVMLKIANKLNIPVIDSYKKLRSIDPLTLNSMNGNGHFNPYGYRVFSNILIEALSKDYRNQLNTK